MKRVLDTGSLSLREIMFNGVWREGSARPRTARGAAETNEEGDGVVFYSPREEFPDGEMCQRFTAIGKVADDDVFQVEMSEDFRPFRQRLTFQPCSDVSIGPLISELSFIRNKKSWGYAFRFGHFEIPRADFDRVSQAMLTSSSPE